MTISSTTNTVSYTGTGSATELAVPYVFFGTGTTAEIQVVEVTIATGAEAIKANGSDYTVSGGSGATGTVTAAVAPATTVKWVINRLTTQTQETDYVENDPFPAESHEEALDRLTAIAQEEQRALDRTAKLPDGYTGAFDPTLPTAITGSTVLAFNSGATAFEVGPTTAAISSAAAEATAAAASAAAASTSETNAATSETNAGTSATAAAASATSIGLTTRGDMLRRGAAANERFAVGGANTVLTTDGTDPAWSTITNAMLAGSIDLTSKVTGALPVANGGTGASTFAADGILYGAGTGAVAATAVGTDGHVLTSNGSGVAPTFQAAGGAIAGQTVQTLHFQTGALITTTTTFPISDVIPVNTLGAQVMSLAITPTKATNNLIISWQCIGTNAGGQTTSALFQDAIVNALAVGPRQQGNAGHMEPSGGSFEMVAGGTSAITFKVRFGGQDAGTASFNGSGGTRRWGGVASSYITAMEIEV